MLKREMMPTRFKQKRFDGELSRLYLYKYHDRGNAGLEMLVSKYGNFRKARKPQKNRFASKGKVIKKRKRSSNKIYKFYSREILIFLSYSLPLSNPLSSPYPGSCGTHSNGAYAYSEWPNTNLTTYLRAGFMMLWDDELAAKCCWAGFSASAHRRDGSKTIDWRHVRSVEIFPET